LADRRVFINWTHRGSCPTEGEDKDTCMCSPSLRARIVGGWTPTHRLPKGWGTRLVDQFERQVLAQLEDHHSGRRVIERAPMPTMREWGESWLAKLERLVAVHEFAFSTLASYRSIWQNHLAPFFGPKRLLDIDDELVLDFRANRLASGYRAEYVKQMVFVLSGMLTDAVPRHLASNPVSVRGVRRRGRPQVELEDDTAPKIIEWDLARALLALSDGPLHEMILLALTTGMRRQEIAGLRWDAVRFHDRRIDVRRQLIRRPRPVTAPMPPGAIVGDRGAIYIDAATKSRRKRTVALYSGLSDLWHARAEQRLSTYVFTEPNGRPFTDHKMQTELNRLWESIGERPKQHSWHVLRHTFSTLLASEGVEPHVIDAVMGHRRPGVAARYQHVIDRHLEPIDQVIERALAPLHVPVSAEVAAAAR
jgi:integrase